MKSILFLFVATWATASASIEVALEENVVLQEQEVSEYLVEHRAEGCHPELVV